MNTQLSTFSRALALSILGGTLLAVTAEAKIVSQSKDIVIEQPTDLPELARRMGIALQLYSETGDGSTYLYVEQHQGQRLLVLNVTDPTRIKMIAAVPLSAPAPFDFVGPVGGSSLLVRFRNNEGMAVLDLKHARLPVLSKVNGLQSSVFRLQASGPVEPLGESAFLTRSENLMEQPEYPRDYQVVDTSHPNSPVLLDTVRLVSCKLAREETGTMFLLGSEGLTIIRRPHVELQYQDKQHP
jgi:hypothetical protein